MKQALNWGLFVVVLVVVWGFAGPTQLGGPASYVVVDGDSMEPTYFNGDLVVARQATDYAVGDVITYDAPIDTQFSVIHRVVEIVDGGYVTQGDNRDEPDGWLAPKDAIYGATWFHIPMGGLLVGLLRQPSVWLALVAGWLTVAVLTRREERERSDGEAEAGADSGGAREATGATAFVSVATVLGLLAGIGVAHAATLVVDGGVIQAFSMPVVIEPPDEGPTDVTISVKVRKYDSGGGEFVGTFDLPGATLPVGTPYQIEFKGGKGGAFVVCPEGDGPLPKEPVEDNGVGVVRTATEDVTLVVCTQTGGNVELRTGDDVVGTTSEGLRVAEQPDDEGLETSISPNSTDTSGYSVDADDSADSGDVDEVAEDETSDSDELADAEEADVGTSGGDAGDVAVTDSTTGKGETNEGGSSSTAVQLETS